MLRGQAWQVEYPGRGGQNFVTADTKFVVDDLCFDSRNLPDWRFRIRLVGFVGEAVLAVNITTGDLLDAIPVEYRGRLRHQRGVLEYNPRYDRGESTREGG